jgi:hypothetical protein
VSTMLVPTLNSISMDDHRPIQFMSLSFDVLGYQLRTGIRTVIELIERRFARFAGVPYQNSANRREWEELWESQATP